MNVKTSHVFVYKMPLIYVIRKKGFSKRTICLHKVNKILRKTKNKFTDEINVKNNEIFELKQKNQNLEYTIEDLKRKT